MAIENETEEKDICGAHICPHKMAWMLDNWLRRLVQRPGKIVGEYIKEGDLIIDFGCGPGFLTLPMAHLAGESGKVIAVDVQPEMLAHVAQKTKAKNLQNRISTHQCGKDSIGLSIEEKADFMVALYMVHETPSAESFFKEVFTLLKPGGTFLIVEPRMHVKPEQFNQMIQWAEDAGFTLAGRPAKKGGHAMLLTK